MSHIKEVNVFSLGDSEKISTWSNVPYFFARSLMDKGVKVNRVNITRSWFGKVLNRTLWRIIPLIHKETTYNYFRSLFHFNNVRRKILRASRSYERAQVNIFLTFSFSSVGLDARPTVLFCDWTYDHHLKYFANKQPDRLERDSVDREDRQIEGADLVFVLFPGVAEYMKNHYRNKNIFYLGNVVNAAVDVASDAVLDAKSMSSEILFIGGPKYLEGAAALIAAFRELKKSRLDLRLNIIGLKEREFGAVPDGVKCYGYLDKARESDRSTYYTLLSSAKMLVNTTPKWGAFSATLEAMHFYTPIITSPYREFVETFGLSIGFGAYCDENSALALCAKITEVFESVRYRQLCLNAHDSVSDYTWDAYAGKLLAKIEEVIK